MAESYLVVFGSRETRAKKALEIFSKIKPGGKPEKDPDTQIFENAVIKQERIKPLRHFLSLKPYQKAPRVIIIFEAQNLTSGAQKLLSSVLGEEKGVFILTASNSEILPEEVSKKCQIINLPLEPGIKLEKSERLNLQKKLDKLKASSPGKRLKEAEEITSQEEALLFCQKLLVVARGQLISEVGKREGGGETLGTIKNLQKTLAMLDANANWRLATENLFLNLGPKGEQK